MPVSTRMSLLLIAACCVQVSTADHKKSNGSSDQYLKEAIGHLYRRYLRFADPNQLMLQDAHGVQYRHGMMKSETMYSTINSTFGDSSLRLFNSIYTLVNPEQRGLAGDGSWNKHSTSDVLISHHHGSSVLFHFLTNEGVHKQSILGNPLHTKNAKFSVLVPRDTYAIAESMSQQHFAFISMTSLPEYTSEGHMKVSASEMAEKFPDFAEMIMNIADPTRSPDATESDHDYHMHSAGGHSAHSGHHDHHQEGKGAHEDSHEHHQPEHSHHDNK